jgi:hypothetical protein
MARKDRDMPDGIKTPTSFSTVDEQAKAKAKASDSTLAAAAKAAQAAQIAEDEYYTKKDSQGKTQAQRDAVKNALKTAADIRENSTTKSAYVDPKTGKVVTMAKGSTSSNLDNEIESVVDNGDGTITTTYKSGRKVTEKGYNPKSEADTTAATEAAKLKLLADQEAARIAEEKRAAGQSAYDLLFEQFSRYGMGSLVEPLKQFITQGISSSEFTLRLRDTDAYKKRFAANAARIAKGLSALNEAEYIGLEDQYQNIMREYGLPASYYARGEMGRQEGFEKFLSNDVSAAELEDRVLTAQSRVLNANPEVLASLKQFYPGISNGDILAYALDPEKAVTDIKRKVTAAEIGGSAMQAGLGITGARAEELGAAGITKAQAQQGFQTVAEVAPRGGQLASIYGESPYTQQTAEQEIFGLAGSTEAAKQRKKLKGLEEASFAGRSGMTQGALGRERAGNL